MARTPRPPAAPAAPVTLKFTAFAQTEWGRFNLGQVVPCHNLNAARHLALSGFADVIGHDPENPEAVALADTFYPGSFRGDEHPWRRVITLA